MNTRRFLLCAVSFCAVFSLSSSLNCYQCNGTDSTKPFQCNEWLSSDIDIKPEPCDEVYEAKYCVKHVGRFEGGIATKRYCSSKDLGNYCNYVEQPGDSLTYRSCVYTCTGDGCNPAVSIKDKINTTLCAIVALLLGWQLVL